MLIQIKSTGQIVEAEVLELDCVRVGDIYLDRDEWRLVHCCASCDFRTTDGNEAVAHEKGNQGHFCEVG
jgi:hypothetical protein